MRHIGAGVVLVAVAMSAGLVPLHAAEPAPAKPQVADNGPTLEQCLKDPRRHYAAVEGNLLRAGTTDMVEFRKQVANRMDTTKFAADRVALYYLVARSWYWQAQRELREHHTREVLAKYRSDVLGAHLQAFALADTVVRANKDDRTATVLRARLAEGLFQLLGTSLWSEGLSTEEKAALVERFLDVVEQDAALSESLAKRGGVRQVYSSLGVAARLDKRIPDPLPPEYDALVKVLSENLAVCSPAALRPIADAIEANHADTVKADERGAFLMARLWQANKDLAKSAVYLKYSAAQNPENSLQVYLLCFRPEAKLTTEERDGFLGKYLSAKPDAKDVAYDHVTQALLADGLGQEGLRVVGMYEKDPNVKRSEEMVRAMGYRRARYLDILNKRTEALAAYKAYMEGYPAGKNEANSAFVLKRIEALAANP